MRLICYCLAAFACLYQTLPQPSVYATTGGPVASGTTPKVVTFSLQLRDGSVMRVATEDGKIQWKTVAEDGTITRTELSVSEIQALKFTVSPASDEVARIRQLVSQLASDDYRQRHAAESILLEEGKPFEKVIEQASDHREPEVRYRVHRILKFLSKTKQDNTTRFSIDFDVVQLKDGRRLEGDIGDWALNGNWNGVPVSLNRENCQFMRTRSPFASSRKAAGLPLETELIADEFEVFNRLEDEDGRPVLGAAREGLTQVNFDTGSRGEKMVTDRDFDVSGLFAFKGIRMQCETYDGIVVISGYRFKKSQSKNRSIGNFYVEPVKKKKTSYQGVTRIDFCTPGNASIPASVNLAGAFSEIVIPEHTVLQAYNAAGHVIGLAQSTRDKTSFLGIRSNEPIAYVRFSANTFLDVPKLNRDFAIDDLTFTNPVAAPDLNFSESPEAPIVIVTHDDQRLLAKSISFEDSQLRVEPATANLDPYSISLDQIAWITPPQSRDRNPPAEPGVFVMLRNGSVIHCQFEQKLVATSFPGLNIAEDQVIGIWDASTECRYPLKDDFTHGSIIAVRPLNRVAFGSAEFDFSNGRFDFDLSSGINLRQALASDEGTTVTAPATRTDLGLDESSGDSSQMAMESGGMSLWKEAPATRVAESGLLRTRDGQEWVLGGDHGCQLVSLSGDTLTLECNGESIEFSIADIHALNLPN